MGARDPHLIAKWSIDRPPVSLEVHSFLDTLISTPSDHLERQSVRTRKARYPNPVGWGSIGIGPGQIPDTSHQGGDSELSGQTDTSQSGGDCRWVSQPFRPRPSRSPHSTQPAISKGLRLQHLGSRSPGCLKIAQQNFGATYRPGYPYAKPYSARSPMGEGQKYWLHFPPATGLVWAVAAQIPPVPDQNQRKYTLSLVMT